MLAEELLLSLKVLIEPESPANANFSTILSSRWVGKSSIYDFQVRLTKDMQSYSSILIEDRSSYGGRKDHR